MNGTQKAWFGALVAAAIAGVSAAVIATEDSSVTTTEWLQIVLAVLVSLGAVGGTVYGVRNKVDGITIPQELYREPLTESDDDGGM